MGDEEVLFRITGVFDPTSATALSTQLRAVPTGSRAVVDFSLAREVSILALGDLARTAGSLHVPIAVQGLPRHLVRVLEYLSHGARRTDDS